MIRNREKEGCLYPMGSGFRECLRKIWPMAQASSTLSEVRPSRASGIIINFKTTELHIQYIKNLLFLQSSNRLFVHGLNSGNSTGCTSG